MQILSMTIDTVHYKVEPMNHLPLSQHLLTPTTCHTSYQYHTYSQITSSHPYATVYQNLFQLPHRININPQHITLVQVSTNFQ